MLVANFSTAVNSATSAENQANTVMRTLFRLFSLYTMDVEAREFQISGAVRSEILDRIPDAILALMQDIRPHCVRLVDAFALPDFLLDRYAFYTFLLTRN